MGKKPITSAQVKTLRNNVKEKPLQELFDRMIDSIIDKPQLCSQHFPLVLALGDVQP